MTQARIERLKAALKSANLDAVALNPGPSLTYLSGQHFHLMERPVVLIISQRHAPAFILPELEMAKMDLLSFKALSFAYGEVPADWEQAFRKAIQKCDLDGRRIGIEPRQMRLLEYQFVKAGAPEADFSDAGDVLSSLRVKKDKNEIEAMRRAVRIAQEALQASLPLIKAGMTEKELAAELVVQLLKHGSDTELPFQPIVSSGPNSANPHASLTERKLRAGDLLVIDWGAADEGYISDLTRTFAVKNVDAEFEKIHKIVQDANAAGRAAARPGAACAEVDKAARAVIEKSGYGKYFTHRTGHGIGMEAHEDPYIRGDNPQILEPGMAFTVEPGIYLMGRNGVRVEDNVVITETGAEVLSDMPRELLIVG